MVKYSLDHLTQADDQKVGGPIQDDEALLLFAMIRVMRLKRILELGGLGGYSARNFLAAVGPGGMVYTVDLNKVPKLAANHVSIVCDAGKITEIDVDEKPLDLVFPSDCHAYDAQMEMHRAFLRFRGSSPTEPCWLYTIRIRSPTRFVASYPVEDGWRHIEGRADEWSTEFKKMGYDDILPAYGDVRAFRGALRIGAGLTIARRLSGRWGCGTWP